LSARPRTTRPPATGAASGEPRRPASTAARLVPWLLLLLVLALVVAVRWRVLDVPLERDEGEYAYAGQLILQGIPPYQLVYNMKLPGTYAMYAVFLALFGQTARGVHLGLLLVNAIAIVLLFRLAQRLFGSTAAVVTAATYALLSMGLEVLGIFAHATHMIVLWVLPGFLALLTALERGRRRDFFVSGLCLCLAFLMKQQAVFFVLFGTVVVLAGVWRPTGRRLRLVPDVLVFAVGAALPFALTCAVLAAAGVFPSFWFWVFRYAATYATEATLAEGLAYLRTALGGILPAAPLLWGLALVGSVVLVADRAVRERRFIVTVFVACAALAVCPGLYFRLHYFVVLLPAVALLAGVAVDALRRGLLAAGRPRLAVPAAAAVFAGILCVSVVPRLDVLVRTPPRQISRIAYGANPFPEAVEVARYIAAHSLPGDRILVLGSEPEIYFYARRRSATGHVYMYGLMENQRYARTMQSQLSREVESNPPAWVVFVGVTSSWGVHADSDKTIIAWANRLLSTEYTPAGLVEIESSDRTTYTWRGAAPLGYPRSNCYLVVLRRNPPA
jgi:hypothetical protein